jgi:hypothetical protein
LDDEEALAFNQMLDREAVAADRQLTRQLVRLDSESVESTQRPYHGSSVTKA